MHVCLTRASLVNLMYAGIVAFVLPIAAGAVSEKTPSVDPWFKKLESSILDGKLCAKYGIFREKQGKSCRDQATAELYVLLCKNELKKELFETDCGRNASKFGANSPDDVVNSLAKRASTENTNLYWLVCESKAGDKSTSIRQLGARTCGVVKMKNDLREAALKDIESIDHLIAARPPEMDETAIKQRLLKGDLQEHQREELEGILKTLAKARELEEDLGKLIGALNQLSEKPGASDFAAIMYFRDNIAKAQGPYVIGVLDDCLKASQKIREIAEKRR